MSWQDNRRRKRTWYRHYRGLCDTLASKINAGSVSAVDILLMFYDLYENRRLHRRNKTAASALESLKLAIKDTGLDTKAPVLIKTPGKGPLTNRQRELLRAPQPWVPVV